MLNKVYKRPSRVKKYLSRYKRKTPSLFVDLYDISRRLGSGLFMRYPYSIHSHYSPFFIIGCGRSGNTLLRKLLMENYDVVIPPEIPGLGNTIRKFTQVSGSSWDLIVEKTVNEFIDQANISIPIPGNGSTFLYYNLIDELELDFDEIKNTLLGLPEEYRACSAIISEVYRAYSRKWGCDDCPWGDKTPWNVFHYDRIKKVFPNAKYVHMLRDGRACVCSYISSLAKQENITLFDACYRWKDSIKRCLKAKRLNENNFITIKYEALVMQPSIELSNIANFLNLSHKMHVEYKHIPLHDSKLRHHSNLREPVNTNSILKWKDNLSSSSIRKVESIIGDLLDLLGYR